ncbi:MAG: M20/M25/M40 family metallo-hydrolase [Candidatus Marinimicrobia bacterium]|jgi:acetylornithine deacetylase/succinyl-diaminopimelate desuccinylase-like protein|nr:M20/M25/M40 family metallo-hydrolase [Candidatus Neomarinimicrobiota bacterium]MBT4069209.1 M20/M25/M40 family metallo-hydrolase [Candidatus Neomarinimicrobiota bacterium]MBT4370685.1 M20/M25/M40 family metallo-hydrolase [Candidatus Neomarinimicrobiota bacterium]MBT5994086.1 M20/M25/M40 family metallo-hydrolase [Candidatus Neomarinimicrobiota bacterium]MBT6637774.1 M20/M25/M40 family metallo-hydrolase [Candidatus Neomarinimicrobiota bacterium]
MNNTQLQNTINTFWDENIIPPLIDYIKIPNKSPSFDSEWKSNGHMDRVLVLASEWAKTHLPENATLTVKETDGRTPLILVDIPGDRDGNILMYGHLDKQPEMEGWNEGLGPWTPVIKDEKLYGRGGADDGYALFASLCAVKALKEQSATLPRILILIEFCEESGSPDLPYYMNLCADVIGTPDLVVCLDSGAGDYKRFWTTTSLRGMIGGTLRVDVLTEGVHSGGASGHVPSSFRIARQLLSRLEDQNTGEILLDELKTQIPDYRIKETEKFVSILGNEVIDEFPWADTMQPSTENNVEGVLRRSWRPALSVVGADGLPPSNNAGNVLRPYTQLQLSMRIPPMVNPIEAQNAIEKVLIENPPYNASISVHFEEAASGWNAPETAEWLALAMNRASEEFYGESSCSLSEGGTIPFMAMLGDQFPRAQFVITGVLGPGSNAHGPNEFLHVPYAKKLTACVAFILNNFPK